MRITRGTETRFEVVEERETILKSDSLEECQKHVADNSPDAYWCEEHQAVLTRTEMNRVGGQSARKAFARRADSPADREPLPLAGEDY